MNRRIYILILVLTAIAAHCRSKETNMELAKFDQTTSADGLDSDEILHMLRLSDGRIAITTSKSINIYDGNSLTSIPYERDVQQMYIPNYRGFCHVYEDAYGHLWLKNWRKLWCADLTTCQLMPDSIVRGAADLFVDGRGRVWQMNDTTIYTPDNKHTYTFCHTWGDLQDLDADNDNLYLFFSMGQLVCYNLHTGNLIYETTPPQLQADETENRKQPHEDYQMTSFVVRGTNGTFYQLRCGERNIFMAFNPESKEWRTVFETSTGTFHCLCVPNDSLALIGCPEGLWTINLNTGAMNLHSELETRDGKLVKTGINSIVCDSTGGIWLGTYNSGMLHSDTIYATESQALYYMTAVLAFIVLLTLTIFYLYVTRQRRREQQLMLRIQELLKQTNDNHIEEKSEPAEQWDNQFIAQAVALVEQNLDTPGYSVERLATDLCMERTGLYKKLNAAINQSPTLFIRTIRMERAAKMLLETNDSIGEIAERTGFSSASYFSKVFQQTYGCKPSDFIEKNRHKSADFR